MMSQWIRRKTKVADVAERKASLKGSWTGHIGRLTDEHWTKTILKWRPRVKPPHLAVDSNRLKKKYKKKKG